MPDAPRAFVRELLLGPVPSEPAPRLRTAADEVERVDGWPEVAALVRFHGLEGLAHGRHVEMAGALLPPPFAGALEAEYRRIALWTTLTVEGAERALSALAAAGIEALLFKGAALVRAGLYPDPGTRRMDDADLLVAPHHADAAVRALTAAGFRTWKPWDAASPAWVDSAAFVDPDSPPGLPVCLDLHWRLGYGRLRFGAGRGEHGGDGEHGGRGGGSAADGGGRRGVVHGPGVEAPLGRCADTTLWHGTDTTLWHGADTAAGLPAPEPHLVLLAEHFLKHVRYKVHLQGLGDVVRVTREVRDWARVERIAAESGFAPALGHLLAGLRDEAGAGVPVATTDRLVRHAPLARSLREVLRPSSLVGTASPAHSRAAGILLRFRLLGSPRAVARDLLHAAFPSASWLRARYAPGSGLDSGADSTPGTLRLRLRYLGDVLRWLTYRGRSPASPNQDLLG